MIWLGLAQFDASLAGPKTIIYAQLLGEATETPVPCSTLQIFPVISMYWRLASRLAALQACRMRIRNTVEGPLSTTQGLTHDRDKGVQPTADSHSGSPGLAELPCTLGICSLGEALGGQLEREREREREREKGGRCSKGQSCEGSTAVVQSVKEKDCRAPSTMMGILSFVYLVGSLQPILRQGCMQRGVPHFEGELG